MSTVLTAGYLKRVDLINLHWKNFQNNFSLFLKRHSLVLLAPATRAFYPGTPVSPSLQKVSFQKLYLIRSMEDEELGTTFVNVLPLAHQLSYSTDLFTYWLIDRFILSFMVVMLAWRGQNSSQAVIKTSEDITSKPILQAVFLGQRLLCYLQFKGDRQQIVVARNI